MSTRIAVILAGILVLLSAGLWFKPLKEGPPGMGTATAPVPYTPPARLYGMTGVWTVIHSSTMGEAGLLGGQMPAADTDYMLPYAAEEPDRLPGGSWDRYIYRGAVDIPGSGWAITWQVDGGPWGGARFAYLHQTVIPGHAPGTIYRGGTWVGQTGWPTEAQYANGYPGPADAHECVVSTAKALGWFYHVVNDDFPSWLWNAYRSGHRKTAIAYRDSGHHLLPVARVWRIHLWLRGVKAQGTWFGPTRRRRHGYSLWRFSHGRIYVWPSLNASKVVRS